MCDAAATAETTHSQRAPGRSPGTVVCTSVTTAETSQKAPGRSTRGPRCASRSVVPPSLRVLASSAVVERPAPFSPAREPALPRVALAGRFAPRSLFQTLFPVGSRTRRDALPAARWRAVAASCRDNTVQGTRNAATSRTVFWRTRATSPRAQRVEASESQPARRARERAGSSRAVSTRPKGARAASRGSPARGGFLAVRHRRTLQEKISSLVLREAVATLLPEKCSWFTRSGRWPRAPSRGCR